MTSDRRFEHDLPDLLADLYLGPAPSYRDDIAQLVARTPQRPAWTFLERWIPMSVTTLVRRAVQPLPWRTIALLALLTLVLVAAITLVAGDRSEQRRLPAPFGPAANGALAVAEDGDIFLIDPATGRESLAIGGPELDSQPMFSRDGTNLAFYRGPEGQTTLWLADSLGRSARPLSTPGLSLLDQLAWSPDGRSILVTGSAGSDTVMAVVPIDGSDARIIETGMPVEEPSWLPPSGEEILFRGIPPEGFGLFAVRADGTGDVRPIVAPTGKSEWDALYHDASPDGRQVAYQWRDVDGTMKLYLVPASGGTPRAITDIESVRPLWSPDGAWIAFWSDGFVTHVVRADGSAAAQLLSADGTDGIAWTPDSQHLAVVEESGRVMLLDPRSGASVEASWTALTLPDWQRLAPTP